MVSRNLEAFLADAASHVADPRDRLAYDRRARQLVEQVRLLEQRKGVAGPNDGGAGGGGGAGTAGRVGVTARVHEYALYDDWDIPEHRGF